MANAIDKEIDAFLSFLATFELARPVVSVSDLSDGAALFEVLNVVDGEYFRLQTRPSTQLSDNWVLRLSSLKRLYRLMTQYFADVLHQPTGSLEVPDLQSIAKDGNFVAMLVICRLTLAIAVQSEKNKEIIDRIQKLSEADQHYLMKAIEQVMSRLSPTESKNIGEATMTDDDHYYQIQYERSKALALKETAEKVYQALLEEHRALQTSYDDVLAEKEDAVTRLADVRREVDDRRNDRADGMMRAEIDRLRADLQKSEDNLGMAEAELDKKESSVVDLQRRVDELQTKADEAVKLKDQVDEYRHAADKLQKTENVMEKYKKKLEESADLRRRVKALEEQNASLVDKNASLEEEYRKVAAFKPLMESYKSQIADLEAKGSARHRENDALRFELEQERTKLKILSEERAKDSEALELYQERVRELEISSTRHVVKDAARRNSTTGNTDEMTESELQTVDDDDVNQGLGGELDDAISGTTMTDLKLQIRHLKRELEASKTNQADASRVMVLENLLDDANRMKARYEADYLAAHREKLVLQRDLEEIRSGKALGDGAEAAIALRQRLNETVDELDTLKKQHTELEVNFETQARELTIAKSDLNLVDKDQLEILATLRESVNEDKVGLEADMEKLHRQIKELQDKNKMQLEQVNALLMEKVSLQSDGIGQRERMLERERNFSDLRASINGKDVPEDIKARLLGLHEENVQLKEQLKTSQDKLVKARAFIKQQDKLFKQEHSRSNATSPAMFEETENSYKTQIKLLEEDVQRQKRLLAEHTLRARKEQTLMLSALHAAMQDRARNLLVGEHQRPDPDSWLARQRQNFAQNLRR